MLKSEIITKAELYLDDSSELSGAEFSDLFDKKYNEINVSRVWEGTKREAATTTSTVVPYVALESDFLALVVNSNHTDSSYPASRPVVFRGTNYKPYSVVSWSDRRQYRNNEGVAYVDFANDRLVFTKQPSTAESVEYDYQASMPALALAESPWFPSEFHDAIYHLMVSDDFMIQNSDKAKSYAKENQAEAARIIQQMVMWNARLVQQ